MDIENIKRFTHKYLDDDVTGHDFYHGQRVANLAQKLFKQDFKKADSRQLDLIAVMGYLHDTIDEKVITNPEQVKAEMKQMLVAEGLRPDEISSILFVLEHMSFSKNIEQHYQLPLIGQYVQDADRLEALGAIGIARAFSYGASHKQKMYDPEIKPIDLQSHDQYRQHKSTTINHFYEKLFNLEKQMNTPAGKKIAQERTAYMRDFIARFLEEWKGI
ncbi:HD domain-containing protein [Lactobacillus psittaci]|uniref:HD superfamily hydrolase n=1 Tax=Lactobacillus psittaci DSM 15354 TaxID=1122152 RepID=A0A0R1S1M8_9LACO|nr:phosphohydrolase [Lactobacillus psittaci]KRL63015.1 HD superfamily hydrolase [Lactobacillus psittaci DSM 15354]